MKKITGNRTKKGWAGLVLLEVALLLLAAGPAIADDGRVTAATLLDRILIEDLVTGYYVDLTSGSGHDLSEYFTEDAILDVNGTVSEGRAAIGKMYSGIDAGEANLGGKVHMLLGNPVIRIEENTARAWFVWTGIMNDNIRLSPRLLEQGREYDELVKLNGRWFIKKRYVTADSGLPALWDKTYKPRDFR